MKKSTFSIAAITALLITMQLHAQTKHLYIDMHQFEPGKVKAEDVAAAHQKDLAVQDKYGVNFMNYWVDEKSGLVYCLSSATDSMSIINAHKEAHGLVPAHIYEVTAGQETAMKDKYDNLFLDIHYLGAGKVTPADVMEAHKKDLAAEGKNDVNFVNYWVDSEEGVVFCLSQANNAADVVKTHQQAHGLLPATVLSVKTEE